MKQLESGVFVSGQIDPADIPTLGVHTLINNRPDGEEPGQPTSDEMEAAANAAGLAYRHIPIAGGVSRADIDAMAEALEAGPVLAFCRSGSRSTYLWALARAARGADPAVLVRQAAEAGYDLSPILPMLAR